MDDATSISDATTADTGGPGPGFIGVLSVLEALKQASQDLHSNPSPDSSHSDSALKALLELETESDTILSKDHKLSALSHHLSTLKTLVATLRSTSGYGLSSFLTRRVSTHSISRVAESIESELQAWIDRETLNKLVELLRRKPNREEEEDDEDELVSLLSQLESRVARGFDRDLQDLILKSKLFAWLQSSLCDAGRPNRVQEQVGFAIAALIRFNKDVFVGQVEMKETIQALIGMSSAHSLKVLCSLIRSIKSPFVDEIESNGEIPKIINLLNSEDLQLKVVAMDCVLEIGYFGRKEAVEAMIEGGLIRKVVELQRSELGGDLIDLGRFEQEQSNERSNNGDAENDGLHNHHNHHHRRQQSNGSSSSSSSSKRRSRERSYLESHPFASCVARFAVQLEVGEGLRQREKRALKQEIIVRVREACVSDADAATIVAEVLWGSSP